MQEVTLKGPRVINGAVRYPVEGPILVSDEEYDKLFAAQAIETDDGDDGEDADGLEAETVAALKALAEKEDIDLGDATRKADVVAAIRTHRSANA